MPYKPYYKYNLTLGAIVGNITIHYDGNPGSANLLPIPVKLKLTWNGLVYTNGFKGDSSYNAELVTKGYGLATPYSSGTIDELNFNKNLASPSDATLEIFLPIYNSLTDFNVICPTPMPTATLPGWTPGPTATPPGPTATPPGWTPGPTATPGPTPTAAEVPCVFCQPNIIDQHLVTPTPSPTPIDWTPGPTPTPTLTPSPTPAGWVPPACCPSGPHKGIEVHIFFGTKGQTSGVSENEIIFDDNYIMGDEHWVVDWYEVNAQNQLSAVLTNRKICCLWPNTTIATKILFLGNPTGMIFRSLFIQVTSPQCGTCKWTEPMLIYEGTINAPSFVNFKQFGGLYWRAMGVIASVKDHIYQNGYWTGPIGPGQSFSSSPQLRIAGSADPDLGSVAAAIAGLALPTHGCCMELDPYSEAPHQYDFVCGKTVPIQIPSGKARGEDSCEKSYSRYVWCSECNSDGTPALNKINVWHANESSCSFEPDVANDTGGLSCPNF